MALPPQVTFLRLSDQERGRFKDRMCPTDEPHVTPREGSETVLYAAMRGIWIFADLGMRVPLGEGHAFDAMIIRLDRLPRFETFEAAPGTHECRHVCGTDPVAWVIRRT